MNYRIFTDTKSPRLLSKFDKPVELIPKVGDIVTIGILGILWVITRKQLNSLDTQGNRSIDFFASVYNTTPDSISLRKDHDIIQRKLNMFG